MSPVRMIGLIVALLVTIVACGSTGSGNPSPSLTFSQEDASHQAFEYREQARYYSFLAKQVEQEAQVLAGQSGHSDEEVKAKLALAQEYHRASAEAAIRATETGHQVPHGMIQ